MEKYKSIFKESNDEIYEIYDSKGKIILYTNNKKSDLDIIIGKKYKNLDSKKFIDILQKNISNVRISEDWIFVESSNSLEPGYWINRDESYKIYEVSPIDTYIDDKEIEKQKKLGNAFYIETIENNKSKIYWFKDNMKANKFMDKLKDKNG